VTDTSSSENVQHAVNFFRHANLDRLLLKLREKYIELGVVGGQIQLKESTPHERREIASFLERPPYRDTTIRVKLIDIDNALHRSRFACSLPDLLAAFFPDQSLITRPQKRAAQASHQDQFRYALQAIIDAQTHETLGRQWLQHGQHGREWLFARYKNASLDEQKRQLATISYIVALLNQLPNPASPERLALFAQRTSGDPHSLDPEQPAGRLFLQALSDLARESSVLPNQGRIHELRLYQSVGLLVDTISSNVVVFHLAEAINVNGSPDPLITAAGARILLLPLCQLLQWQAISSATSDIYVIENPQVFEEVIASLPRQGMSSTDTAQRQPSLPTIICTSGWPSVAALTLLDLLLATSTNRLHYSGDFDGKGLQIASYLIERYPGRCFPWHIDAEAYTLAVQAGGIPASERELAMLATLPTVFTPLIMTIQAQGKWAYQEGITQLLIRDIM
jgi:uncharacterized protein (TIGR02679 family)